MEVSSLKTEEFKKLNIHRGIMESMEERSCKLGKEEWRMHLIVLVQEDVCFSAFSRYAL